MNIAEIRVYRGPNIWCRTPVIMLLLEPGDLSKETSVRIPGVVERLLALMPSLRTGSFGNCINGGIGIGEAVMHLAVALQNAVGADVADGEMRDGDDPGTLRILYPYRDEEVGLVAGRLAVQIVTILAKAGEPDVEAARADLERIAKAVGSGPSTAAIVAAAEARGIPVSRPDEESSFVILGQGNRQRRIWATVTDGTNLVATRVAADKALTTRLLRDAGIPAPDEAVTRDVEGAMHASARCGLPVVIKPLDGNHGRGVTIGAADEESVRTAFASALRSSKDGRVLIQRQVVGRDYRVLVVDGEVVAVSERVPAHVIGDGTSTIQELVEAVNADPRRGVGHESVLTRIDTGEATTSFLAGQGLLWESVPRVDENVVLSGAANLSTGGTAIDRTDDIHPVNAQLAREAALVVGLDVAGIDVVTPDIRRPMTDEGGAIVEVNTAPGFRMHTHPSEGQSRPVAEAVVNHLFPAGSTGRIPIVAVTGTNGKTTTTRMVAHLLRQEGRCVGLTTTDGLYIGDRLAASGDMAGPKSARAVLRHPMVEAAALETARGGIVREGLGFDQCNVGIVMNVTSDHLGLGGVHTLEDLARVKGVVPGAVAATGASVLNADDPLVMGMIPHAGGEIILFSSHEESPMLRQHLGQGGRGAVLARTPDGEMLRLITPDVCQDLILSDNIPATMGGLLGINAVNALAAAAAVWSLGIPIQTIRDGLASFRMGIDTTPGRFNFLEVEGRHVLIDYAHNVAALAVVGDVVRRFGAPRAVGMVALPGDRSNQDTIALGVQTSRIFDTLVVREGNQRGRSPGESAGLIKQGALSTGMSESEIHIVLDEVEAAHAAVDIAGVGDLVVIFVTRAGLIWDELSRRASRAAVDRVAQVDVSRPSVWPQQP